MLKCIGEEDSGASPLLFLRVDLIHCLSFMFLVSGLENVRLETPTVVWNSECRHMLGVVLRELEGATPGLQDVPAIEVHQVCARLCSCLVFFHFVKPQRPGAFSDIQRPHVSINNS